jgi:hypothetical protein
MPGSDLPDRYFIALYYAATLFIFGALDIGFPASESILAVILLWVCYFLAPLLTISYVYTIVEERLLNRLPARLRKHSLILGMGRTGTLMFEIIRQQRPKEKIVIVDRNLANPLIALYSQARSSWWIKNDFENEKTLLRARIRKAKRVFITTNNDLSNITAALKCLELNPGIDKIYCHLQNYVMHKDFSDSLKKLPRYDKISVFNAYDHASKEVLNMINSQNREIGKKGRIFIYLGFGHFGHTLFDNMLSDDNICKDDEIIIATLKTKLFFDAMKYDWSRSGNEQKCIILKPVYEDIYTAECWDQIDDMVEGKDKQIIIINCLDDPEANISLAIQIKKQGPETLRSAVFYCRTYRPIFKELEQVLKTKITDTDSRDIIPFSIEEALKKTYCDLIKE